MLPAILPDVVIEKRVPRGQRSSVRLLCEAAGIECRVTGQAAERVVYITRSDELRAAREPGPLGFVSVGIPEGSKKDRAVLALGILAYAAFDYAARESMRGCPEARMSLPAGRPRKARPLTGADRQRIWRARHCEK